MATSFVSLAAGGAWSNSGGAAGSTVVLECDAAVDNRNRKRPAGRWRLGANAPGAGAAGHALWPSDYKRGRGSVRITIPTGEICWIRAETTAVIVTVSVVA